MADLQANHQYSVLNRDKNNKTLIFVKLTDSAFQSIESTLDSKNGSSAKPTIQCQDNSGVLSFPLKGKKIKYGFTLSNIEGDKEGLQSGFQCLQHIDDGSLESLGFMSTKMQIQANEDSYEKTKFKMTVADQEQKNLCTRELRVTPFRLTHKVDAHEHLEKSKILSPEPEKLHLKPEKLNLKPEKPNLKTRATRSDAALIQEPIRTCVIHILATKVYKKPELMLRLRREGVSEKDKNQVEEILNEVAISNKCNMILKNRLWNEIQEDWKFYSKEELKLIKKKKQEICKSKGTSQAAALPKTAVEQENGTSAFNQKQNTLMNFNNKNTYTNQNESCVSVNNKTLTNGSTVSSTENSTTSHDLNSNLQISNIKKKRTRVSKKKSLASKGINGTPKTISANIPSLLTSFVREDLQNGGSSAKNVDNMSTETPSNQDESGPSNQMTQNTVPKPQLKQSDNYQVYNFEGKGRHPQHEELMNYIQQCKKSLLESPPIKKGRKKSGNDSVAMPASQQTVAEAIPVAQATLKAISTLQTSVEGMHLGQETVGAMPIIKAMSIKDAISAAETFPEFNVSEIPLKYTKVDSMKKRQQYVKDFYQDYQEYMNLYEDVKETSDRFSELNDRVNAFTTESLEYKRYKAELDEEFKKALNNSYLVKKRKLKFLDVKLAHIQQLIEAYDEEVASEQPV